MKSKSGCGGCGSASFVSVGSSSLRDHVSAGWIMVGTQIALIVQFLFLISCLMICIMSLRKGAVFEYPLMNACLAGKQSVIHSIGVGVSIGVCCSALSNAIVSSAGMELQLLALPSQCHQFACAAGCWCLYCTEPPPVKHASVASQVG